MPAIIAATTYRVMIAVLLIAFDVVLDVVADGMFGWKD